MKFHTALAIAAITLLFGRSSSLVAEEILTAQDIGSTADFVEPMVTAEDDCRAMHCCQCSCSPRWSFSADMLIMTRKTARAQTIIFQQFAGRAEVLNTTDLGFDFEIGPRISLARHDDSGRSLEIGYMALDFRTGATVSDGLLAFEPPGGIMGYRQFDVSYGSRLDSLEINARKQLNDYATLMAGLRWVELGEDFRVQALPSPSSIYQMNTDNQMVGFQIGGNVALLNCDGRFRVDGTIASGIYFNRAEEDASWDIFSIGDREDHVAFLGEIGLTAVLQLSDCLDLRAGYQVMWLEGVALAPDQIYSTDVTAGPAVLDTGGSLLYHGAYVGVCASF